MSEDGPLQAAELLTWLDPDFLYQVPASLAVLVQGVRLTSRAVEGQHEPTAQRLAQRLLVDEGAEFADHLGVTAQRHVRGDPLLQNVEMERLEAEDLGLCELVEGKLREWRPAPEGQRAPERLGGSPGVTAVARPSRLLSITFGIPTSVVYREPLARNYGLCVRRHGTFTTAGHCLDHGPARR